MTGDRARPRVGFVLERSLGHITHADNMRRALPQETSIDAEVFEVPWETTGLAAKVPGFNSNWTIRSGIRAWRGIRRMHRARPLDALFVHTQVPAVLSSGWFRRIPTVVSFDATPLQYDELGAAYNHRVGRARVEDVKRRAARAAFRRAAHIVSWSQWAKQGLVDGYGIAPEKVTVVPPGVTPSLWHRPGPRRPSGGQVRILFVGGDLERKGGDVLLAAFTRLRDKVSRDEGAAPVDVQLDLVTKSSVRSGPGVTVHSGLAPNSQALIGLYHAADIFCLPTRADCLPMVLSEAGAAGLPLVSTAVAGIPEIVKDGVSGLVVPPDDPDALAERLETLVTRPELRLRLGDGARDLVSRRFDADANVGQLVELLVSVARGHGQDG